MVISVLLPSLYPSLCERVVKQLQRAILPKDCGAEIVVCSPENFRIAGTRWVQDDVIGNNPANRKAFLASTGEAVTALCDDVLISPNIWTEALPLLQSNPHDIIALNAGNKMVCFDRLYATIPFCFRDTVLELWTNFYPYTAHWGDPAFSMAAWRSGRQVIYLQKQVIEWQEQRLGHPESDHKFSHFHTDMLRFLKDCSDMSGGFDLSNWEKFNHPA